MNYADQYRDGKFVSDMNLDPATKDELLDLKDRVDDKLIDIKTQLDAAAAAPERADEDWWVAVNHAKRKTGQESQYVQRLISQRTRQEKDARIDRATTEAVTQLYALKRAVNYLLAEDTAASVFELAADFSMQQTLDL